MIIEAVWFQGASKDSRKRRSRYLGLVESGGCERRRRGASAAAPPTDVGKTERRSCVTGVHAAVSITIPIRKRCIRPSQFLFSNKKKQKRKETFDYMLFVPSVL